MMMMMMMMYVTIPKYSHDPYSYWNPSCFGRIKFLYIVTSSRDLPVFSSHGKNTNDHHAHWFYVTYLKSNTLLITSQSDWLQNYHFLSFFLKSAPMSLYFLQSAISQYFGEILQSSKKILKNLKTFLKLLLNTFKSNNHLLLNLGNKSFTTIICFTRPRVYFIADLGFI